MYLHEFAIFIKQQKRNVKEKNERKKKFFRINLSELFLMKMERIARQIRSSSNHQS